MRKLFEICLKIQFLKLFWCFLRFEGGGGVEFGQKRCKIACSHVSKITWKSHCLRPGKMTFFLPVLPKNLALLPTSKLNF